MNNQYALQTLGFFLQIFPAFLMAFIPFDEESFRYDRKKTIYITSAVLIVITILFPILAIVLSKSLEVDINLYTDVYMLILVSGFMGVYFFLIQEPFQKKMLVMVHSIFMVVEQFLVRCLLQPLHPTLVIGGFQPIDILILLMIMMILTPVCYMINRDILRKYLKLYNARVLHSDSLLLIYLIFAYFAIIVVYMIYFHALDGRFTEITPLLLFNGLILLLYYAFLMRESVMRSEQEEMRRIHDSEVMQYQKIEHEIEAARRQQHDLTHNLNRLYQLADTGDPQKVKAYIEQIAKKAELVSKQKFCENPVLNNLLQYYAGWAQDNEIPCEVMADVPRLPIDANDLTILFGNIMENAILSNETAEGKKWIRVKAEIIGSRLAILVENACDQIHPSASYQPEKTYQTADAFQSVRFGKNYGLNAVNDICEKYGGSAKFRFDETNHTFTSRILLDMSHPY
ncbi:MAG: GHKL domain-containing protein [Bulleidia sp.]